MKAFLRLFCMMALAACLPSFTSAQSNQYLHFDKVDDFVQLPDASQYIQNASGFAITGWFYTDALGYGQGMMGFRSGTQGFYMIILNNGVIECRYISSAGFHEYVAPANTIVPEMWQHFAWVYDGSSITLYANGIVKGSAAASGQITVSNMAFAIGKSLLGGFNFVYGGRVDEVSVWNKALTQAEIQDMMANELTGQESGLQLYYKFNQGLPGGNNTAITKLVSEVGSPQRDADLMNFALTGDTSNFGGTLNPGYQAISFPQIPDKLTTDQPFTITATATSGLQVFFEVLSGPATVSGDTITLTGAAGQVVVKATQPGGGQYTPAAPVINSFQVLDPATHLPEIDIRSPLAGDCYLLSLKQVQLSAIATITYPGLFHVSSLSFAVDGVTVPAQDHQNGHYTAWWMPPAYGTYTLTVTAHNNYGYAGTETLAFTVTADTLSMEKTAFSGIWLNPDVPGMTADAELPCFTGAFDSISAVLQVSCPTGGCGEWDRVASVDAQGHDGQWFEIIRYITPYGVPCSHHIDLTDYMSLLHGKIKFRVNCATLDNGFVYQLRLNYHAGIPAHPFSMIKEIWKDIYPFGDYANLQPVLPVGFSFPSNAAAAVLKLVSTGHGWGTLNTGNAAEFYNATHHIWINDQETFEQHNWKVCNPNPDGCQPQNGTWYHNRAGWCPGSIAPWFDYDMSSFISGQNIELKYVFYPQYLDNCHPNNPNCVTGVTCADCSDGFNPTLDVACNLVVFADDPLGAGIVDGLSVSAADLALYPNPTSGLITLSTSRPAAFSASRAGFYNATATQMMVFTWDGKEKSLDLSRFPKGVYFLKVDTGQGSLIKKLVVL